MKGRREAMDRGPRWAPRAAKGGRDQVASGAHVPPLRLSFGFCLHFILEIIPVNYESNPRNFPEQVF